MKSAIVTGATGFIGSWLVNELLKQNIDVLALGRKPLEEVDPHRRNLIKKARYLQIDMSDMTSLPSRIASLNQSWDVLYNLAWGGATILSDLNVDKQLNNVAWSNDTFIAASKLGIKKFIHIGTMEEAFAYRYLHLNHREDKYYNRHVVYALAKGISKLSLRTIAPQYPDIDLLFATNSHVMGPFDDKDSFLQVTLQKLVNGTELIFSAGTQMFDVISVHDCVSAYIALGHEGHKGNDYWIGSGQPRRLKEYVLEMAELYPSEQPFQFGKLAYNDISLKVEDFDTSLLLNHTSFRHQWTYADCVRELHDWIILGKYTSISS